MICTADDSADYRRKTLCFKDMVTPSYASHWSGPPDQTPNT